MRVAPLSRLMSISLISCCMMNISVASDTTEEPIVLRKHGDWRLGLDAGVGAIHLELPEAKVSENKFYLGVRGEYVLSPEFLLGIEASGWLIQPGEIEYNTNPPPYNYESQIEGEGLAPVLITARYFPWDDSGWYLKAGAGYVSHWQTHLGVTERKSGSEVMLGGGYDYYINKDWDLAAFISYSTGSAGDEDYDAITLALGLTYKIRRK